MKLKNDQLNSYKDAPWPRKNMIYEDENTIVYKDGFPVTEGHLLFVPKSIKQRSDITKCFEQAYDWGLKGIFDNEWEAFNVGINNGIAAGQTVMWPHVHMIPRRKGDLGHFENGTPYDPRGGVRNIIPDKGNYTENNEWLDDNHWSKRI
jgi:diadenosine tetraphosphate (Ap4A) HIT family hydrolase